MRTSQQALQDALVSGAVHAFAEGKKIQSRSLEGEDEWMDIKYPNPYFYNLGVVWRPAPLTFPPPPEGESWHNPHNLTPEQVGEGYRLLLVSELKNRALHETIHAWREGGWDVSGWSGTSDDITYRVSSLTPFHWDAPKRIPLAPEDFIGAWLKFKDGGLALVTNINNPGIIYIRDRDFTIQQLINEEVLVRLANTTDFVNCYKEEAV